MDALKHVLKRDDDDSSLIVPSTEELTPTMTGLLIALLCLAMLGTACVGALFVLRRIRQRRGLDNEALPQYHSSPSMTHLSARPVSSQSRRGHRRTLTITSTPYAPPTVSYSDQEKSSFLKSERSPPGSPVPEIHITFPEEHGEKRGSRVVVVQITDNGGVGLEPYKEEQLPKYEAKDEKREEWRSLDLERMGGLKEKDEKRWG